MAIVLKNTLSSVVQRRKYEEEIEKLKISIRAQTQLLDNLASEYNNIHKGSIGEKTIADYLLSLPDDCIIINGLCILSTENKRIQLDHVVITRTRVVTVETKYWNGTYIISDDRNNWRLQPSGFPVKNPQLQAREQSSILEELLTIAGYQIRVQPLIVLANGFLENYSSCTDIAPVYSKDKILYAIDFIANQSETLYKIPVLEQKKIAEYLLSLDLETK